MGWTTAADGAISRMTQRTFVVSALSLAVALVLALIMESAFYLY
jgi:hypothetical protein